MDGVDSRGSSGDPMDVVDGRSRSGSGNPGRGDDRGGPEGGTSWVGTWIGDERTSYDKSNTRFFVRLGLTLVVAPVIISSVIKFLVVNPILETELKERTWFGITHEQEEEVAAQVERKRTAMEYSVLMGRATPLTGEEFLDLLRREGKHIEEEEMQSNKEAMANVIGDAISASVLVVGVVVNARRVRLLRAWIGQKFLDMESSTQAFGLLLVADILVGYHSSDGWITALTVLFEHWGIHESETFTSIFVATVPVMLDVAFKYWVFKSLRKISPSTQIILEEIDG